MIRLPFIPTMIVGIAVAVMIGLGIWQLQRADWKERMIGQYQVARNLPPISWSDAASSGNRFLYRRGTGFCANVAGWTFVAGRNAAGEPGWVHIASCQAREGSKIMPVEMGWSRSSAARSKWRGGDVSGVIAPDLRNGIRIVSGEPAPGLARSAAPSPEDVPNNHRFYAAQWFFFAVTAFFIYILALRKRRRRA